MTSRLTRSALFVAPSLGLALAALVAGCGVDATGDPIALEGDAVRDRQQHERHEAGAEEQDRRRPREPEQQRRGGVGGRHRERGAPAHSPRGRQRESPPP